MIVPIPNPHAMVEADFTLFEVDSTRSSALRKAVNDLSQEYAYVPLPEMDSTAHKQLQQGPLELLLPCCRCTRLARTALQLPQILRTLPHAHRGTGIELNKATSLGC